MLRKPNKFPECEVVRQEYKLQYGVDKLEVLTAAVEPDDKIILLDDCVATGGSLRASIDLFLKMDIPVIGAGLILIIPEVTRAGNMQ